MSSIQILFHVLFGVETMQRILVSGALFDQTYGILSLINFSKNEMEVEAEYIVEHPEPAIAVMGKGITGTCLDGNFIWACFSNIIVKIDIVNYTICDIIRNENFNDLHDITVHNNCLYVANTGNESVDIIDLQTKEIERVDMLGDSMRKHRPNYTQNQDTKPHLHHISSITVDSDDNLILGLVRQQRILNLSEWKWIGSKYSSPVHDVKFLDGKIWFTTVGGQISNSENFWDLSDYQSELGWTRGLVVGENGMFVGTTAIRESNHDYYEVITDSKTEQTGAKICWIPFDKDSKPFEIDLSDGEKRKVFSIEVLSK
jgi:hypothetical protein